MASTTNPRPRFRPQLTLRLGLLLIALAAVPLAVWSAQRGADHTAAYNAVLDNDVAVIERIASSNPDAIRNNRVSSLLLHDAMMLEDPRAMTEALLLAGPDVNRRNSGGAAPLHFAVGHWGPKGDQTIKLLLGAGAEVDARNAKGETPFHGLLVSGAHDSPNLDAMKLLVRNGADVNAAGAAKISPLHYAAKFDSQLEPSLALLLENGADPAALDSNGKTPLHALVANGRATAAGVRLLTGKGADVNAADKGGRTALHYVFDRPARRRVNAQVLDALLAAGADVNARDGEGNTPLHLAVETQKPRDGDMAVVYQMLPKDGLPDVRMLLESGADPELKNRAGQAALDALPIERAQAQGVLAAAQVSHAGGVLTFWLQQRKNGVWARHKFARPTGNGTSGGPKIVIPPGSRAKASGYSGVSAVNVPREQWKNATIEVDRKAGVARYRVGDNAEYVYDYGKRVW